MEVHLKYILLASCGGAIGTAARYSVAVLVQRAGWFNGFPLATLMVNIAGCFVIGVLTAISEGNTGLSSGVRIFLITGILGGFTTFSAFGNETVLLARSGNGTIALLNVLLSVLAGIGAVLIGIGITKLFLK